MSINEQDDRDAILVLIRDLRWQVDQMRPRGVTDARGNPYNPSYYKRGLKSAIDKGGLAVVEYVVRYLSKPPSDGYKKLEESNALDLACEALVARTDKPYSHLFSDADRALAQKRLAPYVDAIAKREAAQDARVDQLRAELPDGIDALRDLAGAATDPEAAIAINSKLLELEPSDLVALNRLGRAYESTGATDRAIETFKAALEIDPNNSVASRRLTDLERRRQAAIRA